MKSKKGHLLISVVKLLLMEGQTGDVVGSVQTSRKLHVLELLVLHDIRGIWPLVLIDNKYILSPRKNLKLGTKVCADYASSMGLKKKLESVVRVDRGSKNSHRLIS